MKIKTVYSINKKGKEAVKEMKEALKDVKAKLVLYFASVDYNPYELSKEMHHEFQGITTIGCSSAGEITTGKMLEHSVVAMAFTEEAIGDFKFEIVERLKNENREGIEKALLEFERYFGQSAKEWDYKKYLGIVLFEANSASEEKAMDKIGDLTNIVFAGGTAGDDCRFEQTYLYANGNVYTDSAILLLMKPNAEFEVVKTQSFRSLHKKMVATKVVEEERRVIEFDGIPAAKRYAEVLQTTPEKLDKLFFTYPVGLELEKEYYVRSPRNVVNEHEINFYCNILEGMEVTLLESQQIVEDTKKIIENKIKELNGVTAIIDFQCILRALELRKKKQTEEYGKIYEDIPTIGFATYGEEYIGHINQTSTIILFK